jgi:hypothetical protein
MVLAVLKKIAPDKIYISMDAPKATEMTDSQNCAEVAALVAAIDWSGQRNVRKSTVHQGCKKAVLSGIDWFFSHEDEGIILEDDTVPNIDFFAFCAEMLNRYRNDPRIFMITGHNHFPGRSFSRDSYFFSKYVEVWGWAMWKRSWLLVDKNIHAYQPLLRKAQLEKLFSDKLERFYWKSFISETFAGWAQDESWGVLLSFTVFLLGGYTIVPAKNCITNIGFGDDATQTKIVTAEAALPQGRLLFPLKHPRQVRWQSAYDRHAFYQVHAMRYNIIRALLRAK